MTGLSSCVGRGLLVLALSGFAAACGDDDDGDDHDAGHDSGTPSGGRGGRGGSGGSGGTAGAPPSMSACLMAVDTATMGRVSDSCANCVCENGPREATACNAACWGLVNCYASMCMDLANGMTDTTCAVNRCMEFIGSGSTGAMSLGMVIEADCSTECVAAPETDAGDDAG